MQPDQNGSDWRQPTPQPPQSPYATPPSQAVQPVVTLAPDTPPAAPIASPAQQPAPAQPASVPPVPAPQPESAPPVSGPAPAPAGDSSQPTPPVPETPVPAATNPLQEPVHWQAHEYIHHEKSLLWFIVFGVIIASFLLIDLFFIRSITFGILVPVMAAALLVYSNRPPRVMDYTLSSKGIHINDFLHPFSEFRAFGVIRDGEEYSVMLLPTKRFRPGTTIYFPEEAGEAIVDMLGARLPMQELHLDAVDKLIRKLRI